MPVNMGLSSLFWIAAGSRSAKTKAQMSNVRTWSFGKNSRALSERTSRKMRHAAAMQTLVDEATASFANPASAAGALYAFELQQPATAKSKLEGLDTHYASLPDDVRPYFDAHAGESGEDVMLENKIARMSAADQEEASRACARMAKALWDALSGIHSGVCSAS